MSTPIKKAMESYIDKKMSRMHMPGHKGRLPHPLEEAARWDLTEVRGTDSLYESCEAIAECEERYKALYSTARSLLSAGGSTLCIQAMLAMVAMDGNKIIAGRNIHISAVNAMALLNLEPQWIWNDTSEGLPGRISPDSVRKALQDCPDACAVYVTSPDYFGVLSDIEGISAVCKEYGKPLLVDNAHGSVLHFLESSLHPIALGADMCCDSLHKTLPALTGGALLHISNPRFVPLAKSKMALFGSTSPSYLIMLSCDMALEYLEESIRDEIDRLTEYVDECKALASDKGYSLPTGLCDPTRLTLGFKGLGYSKESFLALLDKHAVEPEYISDNYCVLLPSLENSLKELNAVKAMLEDSSPAEDNPICEDAAVICHPEVAMTLREAIFSESKLVNLEDSVGLVCAEVKSKCPPGIPICVPGEIITENVKNSLKFYGFYQVLVVK